MEHSTNNPPTSHYALITGATGVLGTAYAEELARLGHNLFLTARSSQKLAALKSRLSSAYPAISIEFKACDLTREEERNSLFSYASRLTFDMLLNVAGADIQKPLAEYGKGQITFQIRSCFEGAAELCAFALSHRAEQLRIINICSICAVQPTPYFAVYSASKAALLSLSLALHKEIGNKNTSVTAVIAGAILTRDDVKEYINSSGFWARKSAKTPIYIVKKSLKCAFKGKRKCVPGGLNRLVYLFGKLAPERLKIAIAARGRKHKRKDAFGNPAPRN